MKNLYKKYHAIENIIDENSKVILECLTSTKKFDNIKGFWSSIYGDLPYRELGREDGLIKYQVELGQDKSSSKFKRENFYAILKSGKKERVWKPSPKLKKEVLPQGYEFTNRYLNLSYQVNDFPRIKDTFVPILKDIQYSQDTMNIEGYLFISNDSSFTIENFQIKILKFREESISFKPKFEIIENIKDIEIFNHFTVESFVKFNGVKVLIFKMEMPLESMSKHSGIFSIFVENGDKRRLIQNYHFSFEKKEQTFAYPIDKENIALLNFYYDDVVMVWRFEIYHMEKSEYLMLKGMKSSKRESDIWLIGEYTISARDNGMHFYHYMLKNHPEVEAYYVIEKNSKDRKNLNPARIIEYGSYQHFQISSKAKVLAFSHMPNYLIPKINHITSYKNRYREYLKVFIQHGVIATTTSMNGVRKEIREYNIFNVSSEFEKNIIKKYLNYSDDEVIINGLPRWDRLYNEKMTSCTILVIPTYRNNLEQADENGFTTSKYFKFWNDFLNNEKLIKYIESNNIKIHFFIHIILSRFIDKFEINSSNIFLKNGDNLQDLLLNANMLITDYSSVSFDALFQNKPVIYVPFDFEDMVSMRGGEQYIDYKKELAGAVCETVEETVNEIINISEDGWIIDKKYRDRRLKFFKYIDNNNARRLYKSIILKLYSKYKRNEVVLHKLKQVKNGDLKLQFFSWIDKKWNGINPKLILKNREVTLPEKRVIYSLSSSSLKIKEDLLILVTFTIPLKKLMLESGVVLHVWDFYLSIDNKEYRIKDYNNLDIIVKKLNYDFIPYSTKYGNFSLISIRKETNKKLLQYKKSISFILYGINYKGGVTKVTIDLVNALANRGYSIKLIAINMRKLPNNFYISPKVNFDYISIDVHRKKGLFPNDIYSKEEKPTEFFMKKLKEYLNNLNTDIVYFPVYGSAIFTTILKTLPKNIKKIVGDHFGRRYKIYDRILKNNEKISKNLLLELTTDTHLFNNLSKIDAIHIINPLIKPIYNQVTNKIIFDIPNIVNTTNNINKKEKSRTIIAVGSLLKVKNFDTLIEVFSEIENQFPDWKLEIYGEGLEEQNLKKLINRLSLKKKVFLKGFNANILKSFQESILHVSVSHVESFGLTIVEAMSQKSVVLSTKTTIGAKYLIEDKKTGFLAESNSKEDIVKKLRYVLELIEKDNPIIEKIQDNAYLKSQEFNSINISDKWDKVLSEYL